MPGHEFKTLAAAVYSGRFMLCAWAGIIFNYQFMGYVEELMFRMAYLTTGKYSNTVSMLGGFLFLCIGGFVMIYATRRVIRSVVEAVLPDNNSSLMEKSLRRGNLGAALPLPLSAAEQGFPLFCAA